MNLISKKFAEELTDKDMRQAYLAAQTRTRLSSQIRTLRVQRGWSQAQLGERLHTPQSAISRMEDRSYGKLRIQTLLELATEFDVGLVIEFVHYDEFLYRTDDMSSPALRVDPFTPSSLVPLYESALTSSVQSSIMGSAPIARRMTASAVRSSAYQQTHVSDASATQTAHGVATAYLPNLLQQA